MSVENLIKVIAGSMISLNKDKNPKFYTSASETKGTFSVIDEHQRLVENQIKSLFASHGVLQLEQEVKQLKSHNKTLEGALISICDVGISFDFEDANDILNQAPEQSLAQHDKKVVINAINDACHWLMYEYESGLNTKQIEDALDAYVEQLQQGEGNDT